MMKKLFITLATVIIVCAKLLGQHNFQEGFVIISNDTIKGQVGSIGKNHKSFPFLYQNEISEYTSDQVDGFGYTNGKFFSSAIEPGFFVEVLVAGELSLYKGNKKYFIGNKSELHALASKELQTVVNGKEVVKIDNNWRGLVYYLISDCISNANNTVVELNEKSLTKVVVQYNKCKGAPYREFKSTKTWTQFSFGLSAGLVYSTINSKTTPPATSHLASSYSSIDPTVGVSLEISSPKRSSRASFLGEIYFVKSSYSGSMMQDSFNPMYFDTYIDLNTISTPISMKYVLVKKKINLYFQTGIDMDLHVKAETKLLSEQVFGNVVSTLPEQPAFENINRAQIGFLGGLGTNKEFKNLVIALSLRYYYLPNLNKGEFPSNLNRLAFNITLYKK